MAGRCTLHKTPRRNCLPEPCRPSMGRGRHPPHAAAVCPVQLGSQPHGVVWLHHQDGHWGSDAHHGAICTPGRKRCRGVLTGRSPTAAACLVAASSGRQCSWVAETRAMRCDGTPVSRQETIARAWRLTSTRSARLSSCPSSCAGCSFFSKRGAACMVNAKRGRRAAHGVPPALALGSAAAFGSAAPPRGPPQGACSMPAVLATGRLQAGGNGVRDVTSWAVPPGRRQLRQWCCIRGKERLSLPGRPFHRSNSCR